jgi:hypothetical protein
LFDVKTLILTDLLRQQLKKPLGTLITGSIVSCNDYLRSHISDGKQTCVILVGDTVSRNAIQAGLEPDVIIVDNKEMRRESPQVLLGNRRQFKLYNAQGSIDATSWDVLDKAIKAGKSAVIVDGEEDLLVLVAISLAPVGSLVVYGQPREGIVLVTVTPEKKKEIAEFLSCMA